MGDSVFRETLRCNRLELESREGYQVPEFRHHVPFRIEEARTGSSYFYLVTQEDNARECDTVPMGNVTSLFCA